jgi:hypothetical protein
MTHTEAPSDARECQQMLKEFEQLGLVEKVLDADRNVVRRPGLIMS